jgi:hypothetical protein
MPVLMVQLPWRQHAIPAHCPELSGRLTTVSVLEMGRYRVRLRHSWVSEDLGLVVGVPLDGEVRLKDGVALVAVHPSASGLLSWLFSVGLVLLFFVRTRKAARAIAEDAVEALESYVLSGRKSPWQGDSTRGDAEQWIEADGASRHGRG